MTLYPKRSTAIWLLLACSAFVAGGVWLGLRGEWFGFVCAGFFGLGIPVAVIQLLPGSAYLHIDSTGITYTVLFRTTSLPWSVFQSFCVVTMRQTGLKVNEMVGFDFVPSYFDPTSEVTAAARLGTVPRVFPYATGFRCARSLPPL